MVNLVNSFLSYLLLMLMIAAVAFICGFVALKLRKKKDAKKHEQ